MANDESNPAGGDTVPASKLNDITVGTTAPTAPVTGQVWIDTSGTPILKIWSGAAWATQFAVPALSFGTSNVQGGSPYGIRSDATLAIFDASAPVTQAYGDAAATGSAGVSARRDHVHGMPTKQHIEAKISAGAAASESVTWTSAFASTPVVAATAFRSGGGGSCEATVVTAKSTSGATATVIQEGSSPQTLPKSFIAAEAT